MSKSEELLDIYVRQLLILLHRGQTREEIPQEQRKSIYAEMLSIREQMLRNCHQPWTVEQLCSILNIGKASFTNIINNIFTVHRMKN